MEESNRQSVSGFKILSVQVKKAKDTEKVKLILEADIDDIGAGNYDMGDILKALVHHQSGEMDIGISVFVTPASSVVVSEEE